METPEYSQEQSPTSGRKPPPFEARKTGLTIAEIFRLKWPWFLVGSFLAWGAVVLFSAVLLYITPREYLGRVRMEIEPASTSFAVFPENGSDKQYDPETFMATQTVVITSRETIYKVIDELQLVKKWEDVRTRPEAAAILANKITVESIPGTRLVDIKVLHTDPHEAAEVANAIARAYRERRIMLESNRSSAALDMLNAQEALQAQKVEDARLKMIELMEKFNIVDLDLAARPDVAGDAPDTGTQVLVREAKKATLQAEMETAKAGTFLLKIAQSPDERMLDALVENASEFLSPRVRNQIEQLDKLKAREAVLQATNDGSPQSELAAVRAEIEFYEARLSASIADIKRTLISRLDVQKQTLANLKDIARNIEDQVMDERKRYTQYMEAKRNYQTQSAMLTQMTEELLKEKVDLTMPKDPISIHEIAEPNEVPASPTVETGLISGVLLGFVICIPVGFCVMLIGYAARSRPRDDYYLEEEDYEEAIEVTELTEDELEENEKGKSEDEW